MGIRLHVKSDSQRRKWNMGLEEPLSKLVQLLRAECAWNWIGCMERLGLWCLPWSYSARLVVYFLIKLAWVIICIERLRICLKKKTKLSKSHSYINTKTLASFFSCFTAIKSKIIHKLCGQHMHLQALIKQTHKSQHKSIKQPLHLVLCYWAICQGTCMASADHKSLDNVQHGQGESVPSFYFSMIIKLQKKCNLQTAIKESNPATTVFGSWNV